MIGGILGKVQIDVLLRGRVRRGKDRVVVIGRLVR